MKNYFRIAIKDLDNEDKEVYDNIVKAVLSYEVYNLKRYEDKEKAVDKYALKEFLNNWKVAIEVFKLYDSKLKFYRGFIDYCFVEIINNKNV